MQKPDLHPFGHGGDLKTAAEVYGLDPEQIIDFSANINPLGPPPGLLSYLAEHLQAVSVYPDPACRDLCAAIRRRYRPCHEVVAGNGAGELIYDLMRSLPSGPVLIPAPSFTLYAGAAQAAGRQVIYFRLQREDDFMLPAQRFCGEIKRIRPALVMLCNPNNPTGAGLTRREILEISIACAETGAYLVVDEAFLEFSPDWQDRTMLTAAPEHVLVLCSLTKIYAVPGLRLGFLAMPPHLKKPFLKSRHPWSVNALAQLAGEYILRDREFVRQTVEFVSKEAAQLYAALQKIPGIHPFRPTANYIFLESLNLPSDVLQEQLSRHRILIRDCGNYQGLDRHYVRVAVRSAEDNRKLVRALACCSRP